jgi:miniconductance mechanosensitive channel
MILFLDPAIPETLRRLLDNNLYAAYLYNVSAITVLSFFIWIVARKFVSSVVKQAVKKTKNTWDDIIYEKKVFIKLANIAPATVIYSSAYIFTESEELIKRLVLSYIVIVILSVFKSLSSAALEIYESFEISKEKPLKGIVQIVVILAYLLGTVVILSVLLGKSPALLLSGLGAMTAILMLIFRDTILGFVAGIQIISNNSIRKGDWIVMSKYDADGDVIDIALHAVKVQNWDRTIVSIPTHKFLEESFTNWRGMVESGGRRICRNINIDMSSIHYLSENETTELKKIQLISDYLEKRTKEIEKWNEEKHADTTMPVNGRRLTNIGTFREYVKRYLLLRKDLRTDMTMIVRQLSPDENGLPLQIYVFTATTAWVEYEAVQSDIFDHLLASVEFFGLRVFQNPSGSDIRTFSTQINGITNVKS